MENLINEKTFVAKMDKVNKFIEAKQLGFIGTEDIKRHWIKIREIVFQNRIEKLLIDGSESKVMPVDAQKWFESEYFPSVAKIMAGRKLKVAQLESEDVFSKMIGVKLNKLANQVTGSVQMQLFGDRELAVKWLEA